MGSVDQNNEEEHWEEPWERRCKSTHQTPRQRLDVVSSVVQLSGIGDPTVSQQKGAVFTLDILWIYKVRVWQVRERLTEFGVTGHLSSETVLLTVTSIKEVVCSTQENK
jgi:hypothetical protein